MTRIPGCRKTGYGTECFLLKSVPSAATIPCGGKELPLSLGSDFLLRVRVSPMYAGERS